MAPKTFVGRMALAVLATVTLPLWITLAVLAMLIVFPVWFFYHWLFINDSPGCRPLFDKRKP